MGLDQPMQMKQMKAYRDVFAKFFSDASHHHVQTGVGNPVENNKFAPRAGHFELQVFNFLDIRSEAKSNEAEKMCD